MKIFIYTNGLEIPEQQRLEILSEIDTALGHCGRRIHRVNVYFRDHNATKGGVDKSCRLIVHLRRQPTVVIEDFATAVRPLFSRVLERAVHVVNRQTTGRITRRGAVSMSGE